MSSTATKRGVAGLGALVALISLAAVGCGDDSARLARDGGGSDANVPTVQPPPTQDSCIAKHTDAGVSDEARCLCNKCLQETSACDGDPGCLEIRSCMLRTGCHDMNDCYYGRARCRDEIDSRGIMSIALTLSQGLAACSVDQACSVVNEPECSVVGDFGCDGDEDCEAGTFCCGHFNGALYDGSRCAASCDALLPPDAGTPESWAQMCHPGDECSGPGNTCLAYGLLPDFLYRCEDTGVVPAQAGSIQAGEINCGAHICGAGQKCCVRTPKAPYCAAAAEACECRLPSDAVDAGGGQDDGGSDDAGR